MSYYVDQNGKQKKVVSVVRTVNSGEITVDSVLSLTSENPVQNKVITKEIKDIYNGKKVVQKSKLTQQIENIGEDAGSKQDEPFIFQATATNNGLDSVETAPIAKHLLKQGNSVVVNQLVQNGDFASHTNWSEASATYTVSNNVATVTKDIKYAYARIQQTVPRISGHKYLISIDAKDHTGSGNVFNVYQYLEGDSGNQQVIINETLTSSWKTLSIVYTASSTSPTSKLNIYPNNVQDEEAGNAVDIRNLFIVDLTQWGFTADEIADITANPSHFFNYYNGSLAYNVGTLTNCNGRYLKCIGRNQFNKANVVLDKYIDLNGEEQNGDYGHTEFIRAMPNTVYHVKDTSVTSYLALFFNFDKDKNFIGSSASYNGDSHLRQTKPNTAYIVVNMLKTSVNEQCISIWYSDGTDYDQYFPYEENVYDTGSETLLSAGSARDYKTPDGVIHRKMYEKTFNGTEPWDIPSQTPPTNYSLFRIASNSTLVGMKVGANIIFSGFVSNPNNNIYAIENAVTTYPSGRQIIFCVPNSIASTLEGWKTYLANNNLTGYYELEEETTEQGTSFQENVIVDNYGSMAWLDTSENFVATPQGSQFFYPADYVEFLDSLYTRSKDGGDSADVTNIVVKSELTPFADKDTQLLNAIGGTLRQLLASSQNIDFNNTAFVDLSTLTWTYQAGDTRWYSNGMNALAKAVANNNDVAKMVCSSMKTDSVNNSYSNPTKLAVSLSTTATLFVYGLDSSTKPTGLLAYEKESS